ncbi:hypothetical protein LTR78_006748 [Recurvomyces mirabilis]|uniref:Uncharacterized protein n=1 Tax=Recurvomyces mirabilis TaxID=574656 RepID=A0AAE0WKQ9_9PEZI|nr:hypothetical protein LTR78_006748 [Recurvomyces mirabilis]KAK5151363.1 hypothetical protein LTS14_009206 [Recurvomyces mirabilis]
MYFTSILTTAIVVAAAVNAQAGYPSSPNNATMTASASASTQMFQPGCPTGAPPKGYTYNSSNPFPISTYATAVSQSSGVPMPPQNGTMPAGPYGNATTSAVGGASATGAGSSSTASSSTPSTYTGAASSVKVVGMVSLVSLGAVAAFFAVAL